MKYKYVIVVSILGFLFFCTELFAEEGQLKIGFVDVKKVYEESELKKHYDKEIQELYQQRMLEGREMQQEIEDMKRELRLVKGEAKEKKENEIRQKERQLAIFAQQVEKEINEKRNEFAMKFDDVVKEVVTALGKQGGYDYILSSAVMLYNSAGDDLTEKVIEKINEKFKEEKKEVGNAKDTKGDS